MEPTPTIQLRCRAEGLGALSAAVATTDTFQCAGVYTSPSMSNRLGLGLVGTLTVAWIVGSLFLMHGWTAASLLRSIAVWVDIPLAAWLGGLAWMAYRVRHRPSR